MPARVLVVLVALVALVIVVGCGGDGDTDQPAGASPGSSESTGPRSEGPDQGTDDEGTARGGEAAGEGEAAGVWAVVDSAEGRFRAELPVEPTVGEETVDVQGVALDLTLFTAQVDDERVYNVGFVDYPDSILEIDPRLVLEGVVQGAAANSSGFVVAQEPVDVEGHPGVDYVIEVGAGTVQSRAVLVDRRLYLLQRVGEEPDAAGFARLVGSFDLVP